MASRNGSLSGPTDRPARAFSGTSRIGLGPRHRAASSKLTNLSFVHGPTSTSRSAISSSLDWCNCGYHLSTQHHDLVLGHCDVDHLLGSSRSFFHDIPNRLKKLQANCLSFIVIQALIGLVIRFNLVFDKKSLRGCQPRYWRAMLLNISNGMVLNQISSFDDKQLPIFLSFNADFRRIRISGSHGIAAFDVGGCMLRGIRFPVAESQSPLPVSSTAISENLASVRSDTTQVTLIVKVHYLNIVPGLFHVVVSAFTFTETKASVTALVLGLPPMSIVND
ncbi:hypothetical protein L226DRAFT_522161 [Lentinus tigrinus ALCF2SS1-7]|uniref:Uncharacterized protein n=1 Tax=Lentinus tigrinus ALCF2SS1-6 TaxID=1328759 RepID=A0A5C2SKX7_9APHY|nr:hypothetical protein L227DRAFT_561080 [Lentinus tigrinus ALCF2SS1-6]RPD76623.1 hypothetical protein L226DRAFT_522161 [Lentinus tigrinus ALCF2SS1-7]